LMDHVSILVLKSFLPETSQNVHYPAGNGITEDIVGESFRHRSRMTTSIPLKYEFWASS
jgi:hypothetical protein